MGFTTVKTTSRCKQKGVSNMATINTNMSANVASNAMTRNERSMGATMERLSTGLRINSAKDDAAGLAITSKMTSQINGLNQAVRNANDAISMIQVAEGAMKEVTGMFQRMRELAVQAISDSNTSADRTALNNEYKQLSAEVQRIAENTQWNGTNILDGGRTSTTFQIGANASQTIAVNFGDLGTNNATGALSNNGTATVTLTLSEALNSGDVISYKVTDDTTGVSNYATISATPLSADVSSVTEAETTSAGAAASTQETGTIAYTHSSTSMTIAATDNTITVSDVVISRGTHAPVAATDITSSAFAATALGVLDTAIEGVNSTRAGLGASMSRLEFASDNLQNVAQNSSAARSRVLDADYASETTELARTQIIQQAATAMLSQANQSQQAVLALLK
jgi:flagellin